MKIIEICDVSAAGYRVRISDGSYHQLAHTVSRTGQELTVGADWGAWSESSVTDEGETFSQALPPYPVRPAVIPPTLEHLNSEAQMEANILSGAAAQQGVQEEKPKPVGTDEG